jgi:glycosyltransferase involved in cell wall biosynthesis
LIFVLHVITALDVGGAELMLKRLIEAHQGDGDYRHTVISLKSAGEVGRQLRDLGIEVQSLEMHSAWDFPRAFWQLVRFVRRRRPEVVQTWLYHADLMGGVAARLAGNRNVIWGVRCAQLSQRRMSATQMVVSVCGLVSHYVPRVIVCCAESAREVHAARGYSRGKMVVVPNGYELSGFTRSPELRRETREALGFRDDEVVVGIVGRFDPQKDYRNFVRAAALLAAREGRVRFLMVGRGIDAGNETLKEWLSESGCANRFVLAGERSDVPKLWGGLDILCLSSRGEAFPNVVCEAMAMGVPCVVTDVGDAPQIVAETGIVVAPRDARALAEGLHRMISRGAEERSRLGELARMRIEKHYSIGTVASQFERIYDQVVEKMASGAPKVVETD